MYAESLISQIFTINDDNEFNALALKIFHYQYENVSVYHDYCQLLKKDPKSIKHYTDIPFLPIQFFKSKEITAVNSPVRFPKVFMSSGTTKTGRSKHFVQDTTLYEHSFLRAFKLFYGNPKEWTIIALLPSYQEQGDSSLVYMVDRLIDESTSAISGYYLNDSNLESILNNLPNQGSKTLLIGVSYALLDLIEGGRFNLPALTVMETGGMKGRRKELTKKELHELLKEGFEVDGIHSEYGMTELLSQGYSKGDEWFEFPKWIKPSLRKVNDPLSKLEDRGKTGGVNIIDLANIYSCSFIATQDLGRMKNGRLKIMGRFDHSDTRGCNLLVQ